MHMNPDGPVDASGRGEIKGSGGFDAAAAYRELTETFPPGGHVESVAERRRVKLEAADYAAQADDVVATLDQFTTEKGLAGAILLARETYVEDPDVPKDLREYAEILLNARLVAAAQHDLIKGGLESAERDRRLEQVGEYHHAVAEFAYAHQGVVSQDELTSRIRKTSNDEAFTRRFMNGVVGEVAVLNELAMLDEVEKAEFGTVQSDLHDKTDIAVRLRGAGLVKVDVKYGGNAALDEIISGDSGRVEVAIPGGVIKDFRLPGDVSEYYRRVLAATMRLEGGKAA